MSTLIKNAQILQAEQLTEQDILIDDGRIKAIGHDLNQAYGPADHVICAADRFVTPGLVDVHVHLRDPGLTAKETIETGTMAAAHGGFTTIGAMPNVDPVPDTPEKIALMMARNAEKAHVHVEQYASITKNRVGDELVDFDGVKQAGAFAVSNDGSGVQTAGTMYQAMLGVAKAGLTLAAHVEDDSLTYGGVMNAGPVADKLGLPGILGISESAQIARDVMLAEASGVHYHVCHVSTAESVRVIRDAKRAGINVTCEVSPHHLLLTDADITMDNPMLKMNPPLRSPKDRAALIAGLLDGTIDMIATDHAPHTDEQKTGSMQTAAFGITGLETAFATLYTAFVKTRILTLSQLIDLMSTNPAKLFGLKQAGRLAVGMPADLAIIDLKHDYEIKANQMFSKGHNSPFIGWHVSGNVLMTLVDGQVVYGKDQQA
ncbi:dihydroorotase [Lactiplantibacillus fabifermentans]|uniref:Dihydroorotase n=2 Tax=Lactiplantibacillus fabifermentans TaxID=483011 RepID=A0A0R2NNF4_9LACO|nr:dihydroorotase [Lactiplantibacillus fabifermentans]ETY73511.1 dihydroorotase [Lactiplantibacillus fabifermentans T30PCM01]KRO27263.1 pyrC protein [Lactiplantibacillus fabifermentans DSM 21115]